MPSKKQDAPRGANGAARPEGTGASRIADALHAEPCSPRRAAWYASLVDGLPPLVLARLRRIASGDERGSAGVLTETRAAVLWSAGVDCVLSRYNRPLEREEAVR